MPTPPHHGVQVWQEGISPQDAANQASYLGADIIRYPVRWKDLQPHSGQWQSNLVQDLKDICSSARQYGGNPNLKLLPVIDFWPYWVDSVNNVAFTPPPNTPNPDDYNWRHFSTSAQGCHDFGMMVGQLMKELHGYADMVEISNEPNILVDNSNSHAAGVPPDWYGAMCAQAILWIDTCTKVNGQSDTSKCIIIGAVDCLTGNGSGSYNQGNPHPLWMWGYPADIYMWEAIFHTNVSLYMLAGSTDLTSRVHASCHPYPYLKTEQSGTIAAQQTWARYEKVRLQTGAKRLWITEAGASSYFLSPSDPHGTGSTGGFFRQAEYVEQVLIGAYQRSFDTLEGVVLWPLKDYLYDPQNPFFDTGLYDSVGSMKVAASRVRSYWTAWN